MKKTALLLLLITTLAFACGEQPSLEGLWIVENVKVGDQEMTPNARWARFHSDSTFESGNGKYSHSFGKYNFSPESNELALKSTNGLEDVYEPFKVSVKQNEMTWMRTEEGQKVEVILKRTDELPFTYSDQILGLWQLDELSDNGPYFQQSESTDQAEYIFFRWDKRFVMQTQAGRINGVYNVNGHRPEVELIPYGDQFERDFWKVDFNEDQIILNRLNTDSTVTRTFSRIHQFPE
ncbi:hypothetical protein [Halocola ammonii]